MTSLVIVEHDNQTIKPATFHAITAAGEFGKDIHLLVVGYQCENVVTALIDHASISNVRVADNAVYAHQLPENTAPLIAAIAKDYDAIIASATTFGKNVLPRTAALLNVSMLSDVTAIVSNNTFIRPIYAGNLLATVESNDQLKVITVRTTAFPATTEKSNASCKIERLDTVIENHLSRFEAQQLTTSSRPELTSAKIVIAGGRGLKSAENFKLIEKLADQLGAAIGASRAAVDAGFVPNDYQVGQTGKIVAPELYIAIGISGAIQHLAGMKDSKIIVAINNDPDAPIFQEADYILEGDLFNLIPELSAELAKLGYN